MINQYRVRKQALTGKPVLEMRLATGEWVDAFSVATGVAFHIVDVSEDAALRASNVRLSTEVLALRQRVEKYEKRAQAARLGRMNKRVGENLSLVGGQALVVAGSNE